MLDKNDLAQIAQIMKAEVDPLRKDIKAMKQDITKIRKDQNIIISFFDNAYLELRKRIEQLEQAVGI